MDDVFLVMNGGWFRSRSPFFRRVLGCAGGRRSQDLQENIDKVLATTNFWITEQEDKPPGTMPMGTI